MYEDLRLNENDATALNDVTDLLVFILGTSSSRDIKRENPKKKYIHPERRT